MGSLIMNFQGLFQGYFLKKRRAPLRFFHKVGMKVIPQKVLNNLKGPLLSHMCLDKVWDRSPLQHLCKAVKKLFSFPFYQTNQTSWAPLHNMEKAWQMKLLRGENRLQMVFF